VHPVTRSQPLLCCCQAWLEHACPAFYWQHFGCAEEGHQQITVEAAVTGTQRPPANSKDKQQMQQAGQQAG
jgi:hypothetical protein